MKIVVNKEVRQLLSELDAAVSRFDASVAAICTAGLDTSADHQIEKAAASEMIVSIAYRINRASTGKKDWREDYQ